MSWKAFTPAIIWLLSMAPVYSSCAGRDGNASGSPDAPAVREGSGSLDATAVRDGNGVSYVYLCEGPMSKVYHYSPTCRGLRRCSTKLDKMTVEEAVKRGRRVCGYEK